MSVAKEKQERQKRVTEERRVYCVHEKEKEKEREKKGDRNKSFLLV